jgi:hypothetical protein
MGAEISTISPELLRLAYFVLNATFPSKFELSSYGDLNDIGPAEANGAQLAVKKL